MNLKITLLVLVCLCYAQIAEAQMKPIEIVDKIDPIEKIDAPRSYVNQNIAEASKDIADR
jgi:hypothetical protein